MSNYRDKVAAWAAIRIEDNTLEKTAVEGLEAGGLLMSGPMNKGVFLGATKAIDVANPVVGTLGYKWNRMLNKGVGGLLDRVQADEVFASSLVKGLSDRTMDIAQNAIGAAMKKMHEKTVASPTRQAILTQLKREDDIIGLAPQKDLLEAYHTMKNFAPTLSTDKNAVKSFLRQAVQHEGGVDFMSIKGLADAEAAVTGRAYKGGA